MILGPTLIGSGIQLAGGIARGVSSMWTGRNNFGISAGNAGRELGMTLGSLDLSGVENDMRLETARLNAIMTESEVAFEKQNAERMREFAMARTATARERMRRTRREFDRFRGAQRAQTAKNGVMLESGSALDVLIDSDEEMKVALSDMADESRMEYDSIMDQAYGVEFGADQKELGSRLGLLQSEFGHRMGQISIAMGRISAQSQYSASMTQAQYGRMDSFARGVGGILGAAGGAIADYGQYQTMKHAGTNAGAWGFSTPGIYTGRAA